MKKIPAKCLTCKFMEFLDDELTLLFCVCESNNHKYVDDDYVCEHYELNKAVEKDAKMGCW